MSEPSLTEHAVHLKQQILPDACYTKPQAAQLLSVHEMTIHRRIQEGKLKASYVGRNVRIRGAAILEMLKAGEEIA
jgi:excisionase family DNA binding protein